jgi:hypothetical protein
LEGLEVSSGPFAFPRAAAPFPLQCTRQAASMGLQFPRNRVIQEHIKKPLAEELLFGKLAKGGNVKVGVKDGAIDLRIEESGSPRLSSKKRPPLLTAD